MKTEQEIRDELAKCQELTRVNKVEFEEAVKAWNKEKMSKLREQSSYLAYRSGTLQWVLDEVKK